MASIADSPLMWHRATDSESMTLSSEHVYFLTRAGLGNPGEPVSMWKGSQCMPPRL